MGVSLAVAGLAYASGSSGHTPALPLLILIILLPWIPPRAAPEASLNIQTQIPEGRPAPMNGAG